MLLALVSFLPFPTEVLARYGLTNVATVYYRLTMFATSIGFNVVLQQVRAAHPQSERRLTLWSIVGLALYPIATFIAYFAPLAGIIAMGGLAAFYMFPRNVAAIVLEETSSGNR